MESIHKHVQQIFFRQCITFLWTSAAERLAAPASKSLLLKAQSRQTFAAVTCHNWECNQYPVIQNSLLFFLGIWVKLVACRGSLIKYHQITGSSARYFCKPVLHSFLASCRRHLHLEWPGLQSTSANKMETYAPSCGRLAESSQKVPQNNSCHQFVPSEMASHHSMSPATGSLLPCEEVLNLHSFSPALLETAKVLVTYCPWCFTCLVFWFRCGFTQMLLAFQRGEKLHISLLRTCATFIHGFL